MLKKRSLLWILGLLLSGSAGTAVGAKEVLPTRAEFERVWGPDSSPTASVQRFVRSSGLMSGDKAPARTTVSQGRVLARLLTPLNSEFNFPGDPVLAEVVAPASGTSVLPPGTQLRGFVEGMQRTGRMQRDGELVVKFYEARFVGDEADLTLAAGNEQLAPPAVPPTAKQKLRAVLMFSARLAIPLALGTGGTSLAITTGAGALIGAALCDNHRYVQGAMRGAWEGSGLSIFDSIVQKGQTLAVPVGTQVALDIDSPVQIPRAWCLPDRRPSPAVSLSTSAQLINPSSSHQTAAVTDNARSCADSPSVSRIKQCLDNKDLAKAMQALADVPPDERESPAVVRLREQLWRYVTGGSPLESDSAGGGQDEQRATQQIY